MDAVKKKKEPYTAIINCVSMDLVLVLKRSDRKMKRTLKRGLKVREMAKMEGIIVSMDIYIIHINI